MAETGWAAFEADAPDLAERVRERFAANLHHIIGTVRADGSPRLSGTEVRIGDGDVTVGMMPGSRKLADVQRDPRVEIHSAPLEEDLASGDAKLAGALVELPAPEDGVPGSYFRVDLGLVSLVQVDGDELAFTTWRPGRGVRTTRRR
ncbi:MAG: pyridoxamine 5-phosphate oxidase [Actinobacteria bacterium]|nr:pyridoxamine 5-phosphate oxidase [Actinomycetota bacterium]